MAIVRTVWKADLGAAQGDGAVRGAAGELELSVVREDRKAEILFSLVEDQGKVKRRLTFVLTDGQAMDLARFLAGVSTSMPIHEAEIVEPAPDEDDEQTDPTRPGRPTGEDLE